MTKANGSLTQRYRYTSFGVTTHELDESRPDKNFVENRYGFTGRELEDEAGLYYYRARYYDPELGRFISEDPTGFKGGQLNLYLYTYGDPINFTDPSGRFGLAGFAVGYVGGFVGGYAATGSFTAALIGGLAGGAVGAVLPTASSAAGVFASNFVSNLAGQALANAVDDQPGFNVDPLSPFTSSIGGVLGASAVKMCLGVGMRLTPGAAAALEGLGSGLGELGGSTYFGNQPINVTPLFTPRKR